ncbi:hypothetical protein SprV_0301136800 [Sparganum proliferum]
MDRLLSESEVDVFRAVETVKRNRPQLVENVEEYKLCYACVFEMSMILREQLDENEKERNRDPFEIFDDIDKEMIQSGRQPETLGLEDESPAETEKDKNVYDKESCSAHEDSVCSSNVGKNVLNETGNDASRPTLTNDNKSKNKRLLPHIGNSSQHHNQQENNERKKARRLPPIKVYLADKSFTQVRPQSDQIVTRVPQISPNCARKLPIITKTHNPYFNPGPNSQRRHLPDIRPTRLRRKLPFVGSVIENPLNTHEFEELDEERVDSIVRRRPTREHFDITCISRKAGQWKEQQQKLLEENKERRRPAIYLSHLSKRKTLFQLPRQPQPHDQNPINSNGCAHDIMPPALVRTETETSYLTSSLGNSPSPKCFQEDQMGLL